MLQRMLDHHPQLAVANDSHFIPRCLEEYSPESIGEVLNGAEIVLTDDLIRTVQDYHRFWRLGVKESVVSNAAATCRTYAEFVGALYAACGRQRGKPLAGEKTPDYVRHIALLHRLFPWARFVHLVRDGRNVALSLLQWAHEHKGPGRLQLWSEQPIAVCALWWRWLVATGRRSAGALPSDLYVEIRYEDLVASPESRLREIAAFLGLPYAPEMLRYHEGERPAAAGLAVNNRARLPPTAGLRDWRTQMAPRDVELFEALAADLLTDLGYETADGSASPDIAAVADSCRRWWDSNWNERFNRPRKRAFPSE